MSQIRIRSCSKTATFNDVGRLSQIRQDQILPFSILVCLSGSKQAFPRISTPNGSIIILFENILCGCHWNRLRGESYFVFSIYASERISNHALHNICSSLCLRTLVNQHFDHFRIEKIALSQIRKHILRIFIAHSCQEFRSARKRH